MKQSFVLLAGLFLGLTSVAQSPSTASDSISQSVTQLMTSHPEARLQDVYKSFYQDRYGPGHLLQDTAAAKQYLARELENNEYFGGPSYEPTGWKHQFYRVNLSVIKDGLVDFETYFDAFYRSTTAVPAFSDQQWRDEWKEIVSAVSRQPIQPQDFKTDSLRIDSMMQAQPTAVHHSRAYNAAYAPHYRIIAKDIFECELYPLIKEDD